MGPPLFKRVPFPANQPHVLGWLITFSIGNNNNQSIESHWATRHETFVFRASPDFLADDGSVHVACTVSSLDTIGGKAWRSLIFWLQHQLSQPAPFSKPQRRTPSCVVPLGMDWTSATGFQGDWKGAVVIYINDNTGGNGGNGSRWSIGSDYDESVGRIQRINSRTKGGEIHLQLNRPWRNQDICLSHIYTWLAKF